MKKYSCFIFLCFVLLNCQFLKKPALVNPLSEKKQAVQPQQNEKKTWEQIKNQKNQSMTEYLKTIDLFIKDNKDKDIVFSAYILKAEILLKNKKKDLACSIYHKLIKSPVVYTKRWEVHKESAKCHFKSGKTRRAVQVLESLIQNPGESTAHKKEAAGLQWSFLKKEKALTADKLISLSHLIVFSDQVQGKKFWFNTAQEIIDNLPLTDLVVYSSQANSFGELEPYLLYKAGQYFLKAKEFKKSEKYFKKSLSTPLAPHLKKEVKQALRFMKKVFQVNPYLIGVIVPLSGRRQALGEKILRGLYIGFSMDQSSPWQIAVLDSQSHPEVVRTHINDLFYKHHVIGLVGGLTGETAEVMAQKAEEFAIPAMVLSQKQGITQNRAFVFQNAITAQQLLTPLIKEVRENLKIKNIAVLQPDDSYGRDYSSLFLDLFKKRGGKISGKEIYKPKEVDFKSAIKNLLHLDIKGREEEFENLKAKLLQNKTSSTRSLKLTPENILPVKKEFSAVFVPDSLSSLKKIQDHFKYYGVTDIYFLGTNLWKLSSLTTTDFSSVFVNLPEKDNKIMKRSNFYKKFTSFYSYPPGHFEQRSYNTALFFKQALEKNIKTRFDLQKELGKIKKFQGAYYSLSLSKDHVIQYPLKIYEISAEKKK